MRAILAAAALLLAGAPRADSRFSVEGAWGRPTQSPGPPAALGLRLAGGVPAAGGATSPGLGAASGRSGALGGALGFVPGLGRCGRAGCYGPQQRSAGGIGGTCGRTGPRVASRAVRGRRGGVRCAAAGEGKEIVSDQENKGLYEGLRDRMAVTGDVTEGAMNTLPSPKLTPQQVISTVLRAMKVSPKRGSRVTLRFMSEACKHAQMTPQGYEKMLREGGQTAVLLGNFRSFAFPTPTFEQTSEEGKAIAVQEVLLFVPGFLAAHMGASRGWDINARLRWQLSKDPTGCWLTDEIEILPPREGTEHA